MFKLIWSNLRGGHQNIKSHRYYYKSKIFFKTPRVSDGEQHSSTGVPVTMYKAERKRVQTTETSQKKTGKSIALSEWRQTHQIPHTSKTGNTTASLLISVRNCTLIQVQNYLIIYECGLSRKFQFDRQNQISKRQNKRKNSVFTWKRSLHA